MLLWKVCVIFSSGFAEGLKWESKPCSTRTEKQLVNPIRLLFELNGFRMDFISDLNPYDIIGSRLKKSQTTFKLEIWLIRIELHYVSYTPTECDSRNMISMPRLSNRESLSRSLKTESEKSKVKLHPPMFLQPFFFFRSLSSDAHAKMPTAAIIEEWHKIGHCD